MLPCEVSVAHKGLLQPNHFPMWEQFSPQPRGTSSALGYNMGVISQAGSPSGFFSFAFDPLTHAKLITDQQEW